jgi:hypothetical protein
LFFAGWVPTQIHWPWPQRWLMDSKFNADLLKKEPGPMCPMCGECEDMKTSLVSNSPVTASEHAQQVARNKAFRERIVSDNFTSKPSCPGCFLEQLQCVGPMSDYLSGRKTRAIGSV